MVAGAIDKVTEERMNKGLITSSLDALSGQAAGVQVTPKGNQEAMVSAVRVIEVATKKGATRSSRFTTTAAWAWSASSSG